MAGADSINAKVEKCMQNFLDSKAPDKSSIKGAQLVKCFDACGLSAYRSTLDASVFPRFCDKAKKCSIKDCATKVIDDIAAVEVGKKRPGGKKAPLDDDEVKALANDIRAKIADKAETSPDGKKAVKVDKATARLTDTSKYTGSHKERFDDSGKGKGIEGRADMDKNTGYVGNYKGDGTYDKKK